MTAARSVPLPLETLTRRFAQNKSEIDGLGCHQVNFRLRRFLTRTFIDPSGVTRIQLGRRLITIDLTVNGNFFRDGLARKSLFPRRNRTAFRTNRAPAIPVSDEFTGRVLRGRKE